MYGMPRNTGHSFFLHISLVNFGHVAGSRRPEFRTGKNGTRDFSQLSRADKPRAMDGRAFLKFETRMWLLELSEEEVFLKPPLFLAQLPVSFAQRPRLSGPR